MDDITKRKLLGAGKVVLGGARMVSGLATACGVGLLGGALRHHHMQRYAPQLARASFEGGKQMLDTGWRELHQ